MIIKAKYQTSMNYFNMLPSEIIQEISLYLDIQELGVFLTLNNELYGILTKESFHNNYISHHCSQFKNVKDNWGEFYCQTVFVKIFEKLLKYLVNIIQNSQDKLLSLANILENDTLTFYMNKINDTRQLNMSAIRYETFWLISNKRGLDTHQIYITALPDEYSIHLWSHEISVYLDFECDECRLHTPKLSQAIDFELENIWIKSFFNSLIDVLF
jgi:hypothetical protein